MRTSQIQSISIIASVLLHLFFIFGVRKLLPLLPEPSFTPPAHQEEKSRLVYVEFNNPREVVETPNDAIQKTPTEKTDLVSDKNSIARDRYTKNDKLLGAPNQRGDFAVNNLYENRGVIPGEDGSSQQQQNQADMQQGMLPGQAQQKRSDEALYASGDPVAPTFSRQALLGKNARRQQWVQDMPIYNNDESSAGETGGLSFNTYAWDFAPYMLKMKRKIQQNIFPPPAFTHMGMIGGETLIRFKVMPNGVVKDVQVLKYTGHESLMETSVKAIENSSAFDPLPADFPENYLEVTAMFNYQLLRQQQN
jgi:outer membrane biosynthesis protein TonB